ncbi:hypothetical protein KR018_011640 [Drosophila ironensis]|nr:hypothetical protein KR018_011640 [Drosophila ironensis]
METITPNTRMMLLLPLWVLLFGCSVCASPLDSHELELLEMMFKDAEDYPSSDRDQRDIGVLPAAASIGYEDESESEEYNMFNDLARSEECLDFLPPCDDAPLDPCLLRMLLLQHDPCSNFTSADTRTTTEKPKTRKCKPKQHNVIKTVLMPQSKNDTLNATISTTTSAPNVSAKAEPDSKIIRITKLVPKKKKQNATSTSTTTTTVETTTVEETTTPVTTTETEPPTTTDLETTTTPPTTTPTTTTTTTTTKTTRTTTEDPELADNLLKRYKGLRKKKKLPSVPDPPKIKLDATSQPSEVIQVIVTTEAAELKIKPDSSTVAPSTTSTPNCTTSAEPETTTVESCEEVTATEDSDCDEEGESMAHPQFFESDEPEEPCTDTEEQDTKLCPQVLPAQRNGNSRPLPAPRYRKPVKNYVEPILYEGNLAKQHNQMTSSGPQQRDYFVSNKQVMPRPRPKYRKRIPPSIYVNNIVRGMDCNDEVDPYPEVSPKGQPFRPQRFWDLKRIGFVRRNPGLRKPVPERMVRNFAPPPVRRMQSYPENSFEMQERQQFSMENSGERQEFPREPSSPRQVNQFLMERDPEPLPLRRQYPEEVEGLPEEEMEMGNMPAATSTPVLDPCQQEHDFLHRKIYNNQQNEHNSQQPAPSQFFT